MPQYRTTRLMSVLAAALSTMTAAASPVEAQQQDQKTAPVDGVTLSGEVVDASSRSPIPGAVVRIQETGRAVLTDGDGRWVMTEVSPGVLTLAFEQLGYTVVTLTQEARPDPAPIRIALEPKPLVLEGLRVMVDRLRLRRLSAGISSRVLGPEDFAKQSKELLWAVRASTGLQLTECRGRYEDDYWCVYRRGETFSPAVWIDDRYTFMGLDELEFYWTSEIYAVEIYQYGAALRVYTRAFMEAVAEEPRALRPIWLQ